MGNKGKAVRSSLQKKMENSSLEDRKSNQQVSHKTRRLPRSQINNTASDRLMLQGGRYGKKAEGQRTTGKKET